MRTKINYLNQIGDTIVEVLIAISVLSLALGMAFAIANRSRNTIQANQERYQAQLIANSQADNIKLYIALNGSYDSSIICFDQYGNGHITSPECNNVDNLYNVSISPAPGNNNIHIIKVTWNSLIGGQDNVELVYGT